VEETALLEVLALASERSMGEQVLLYVWTPSPAGQAWVDTLAGAYEHTGFVQRMASWDREFEMSWWALERSWVEVPEKDAAALLVRGLSAVRLTAGEVGTHLFCPEHTGVVPVQVHAWPVDEKADPRTVLAERREARQRWLEALSRGEAGPAEDPLRMAPVVRLYNGKRGWIDLRTGLVGVGDMPDVPAMVLAGLPLPEEVRGASLDDLPATT
jgi:hypothetical protein